MLTSSKSFCKRNLSFVISTCSKSSILNSEQFFYLYNNDMHSIMESYNTNWSIILTNSSARGDIKPYTSINCENKITKQLFGTLLHTPQSYENTGGSLTTITSFEECNKDIITRKKCKQSFNKTLKEYSIKNKSKLIFEISSIDSFINYDCNILYSNSCLFANSMATILNNNGFHIGVCFDNSISRTEDLLYSNYSPSILKFQISNSLIQDTILQKQLCKTIALSLCKIPHFATINNNIQETTQHIISKENILRYDKPIEKHIDL